MTAKKLIQQLQTLPEDTRIFVSGYEGGVSDAANTLEIKEYALNVNRERYYGEHEEVLDRNRDILKDKTIVRGVVL